MTKTGSQEDESVFEPLWRLLEPIQSIGSALTGWPANLHQLRREAESLAIRQEKIDSGLVTDENEIGEFEERKDEFLEEMKRAFSRGC